MLYHVTELSRIPSQSLSVPLPLLRPCIDNELSVRRIQWRRTDVAQK